MGTGTKDMSRADKRFSIVFPLEPPDVNTAILSPPNFLIALLTLIPPPPASKINWLHRIFFSGTRLSKEVLLSKAGFMVSVTIISVRYAGKLQLLTILEIFYHILYAESYFNIYIQ
jgi:hypothetical protein